MIKWIIGVLLVIFSSCSDFYMSMTENGDAVYTPPPDTVLDTIWVVDSLVIPLSYSLADTLVRGDFEACAKSAHQLRFKITETDADISFREGQVKVSGAVGVNDSVYVQLGRGTDDFEDLEVLEARQYFLGGFDNYYFESPIEEPGTYQIQFSGYQMTDTSEQLAMAVLASQQSEQEDLLFALDSIAMSYSCTTVVADTGLSAQTASWDDVLNLNPQDTLWGDFSGLDSLNIFLVDAQDIDEALDSLVFGNPLPFALYEKNTSSDTMSVSYDENKSVVMLVYNTSNSSIDFQAKAVATRQLISP